jgi:hypothetical protein
LDPLFTVRFKVEVLGFSSFSGINRAVEMILACCASHGCGGVVSLTLADRDVHPLVRLPRA